jgi:hypothetical protein
VFKAFGRWVQEDDLPQSKSLTPIERKYQTYEQECLASCGQLRYSESTSEQQDDRTHRLCSPAMAKDQNGRVPSIAWQRKAMREYKERIEQVEHGAFNALVFTTAGGAAPQSSVVIKRLAEQISEKQSISRSLVA